MRIGIQLNTVLDVEDADYQEPIAYEEADCDIDAFALDDIPDTIIRDLINLVSEESYKDGYSEGEADYVIIHDLSGDVAYTYEIVGEGVYDFVEGLLVDDAILR